MQMEITPELHLILNPIRANGKLIRIFSLKSVPLKQVRRSMVDPLLHKTEVLICIFHVYYYEIILGK